ncbi:hypothetical protein SNARM312S_08350 [Streptomyces narbonensis]
MPGVGEGPEVEGVAAAGRVELGDLLGRHLGGEAPGAVVRLQRAEVQPREGAGVGRPGEGGGDGGRGLALAARRDDQDGSVRRVAQEVVEEGHGRRVRPVEVVKKKNEPGRRNTPQRGADPPYGFAVPPRPGRRVRAARPFDEPGQLGQGRDGGPLLAVEVRERVQESLEGSAAVPFGTPGPAAQDGGSTAPGPYRELGHQPGLADAGLARDIHGHRAHALSAAAQQPVQPVQFPGSPDEGRSVGAPPVRESVHVQSPSCGRAVVRSCRRTVVLFSPLSVVRHVTDRPVGRRSRGRLSAAGEGLRGARRRSDGHRRAGGGESSRTGCPELARRLRRGARVARPVPVRRGVPLSTR